MPEVITFKRRFIVALSLGGFIHVVHVVSWLLVIKSVRRWYIMAGSMWLNKLLTL